MIQAKPTPHGGYMFRSQLEARWALFFDKIHVPYIYELDGYTLKGGAIHYRPDFWVPECKTFVEVKPFTPSAEEMDKAFYLALESGFNTVIVCGDPYGLLESHWYFAPPQDAAEREESEDWWRDNAPHIDPVDYAIEPTDVIYTYSKEVAYLWQPDGIKMSRKDGWPFNTFLLPYFKSFDELDVKNNPHATMPFFGMVYVTTSAAALEARMHQFWKPRGQ